MKLLTIIGIIAVAALVLSITPLLVMVLWNWLMPMLFGLPTMGFWHAVGLTILMSLLTGGIKVISKN